MIVWYSKIKRNMMFRRRERSNKKRKSEYIMYLESLGPHSGTCGRPILGHRAEKYSQLKCLRYEDIWVKGLEDRIKTIDWFRMIVKKHSQKEEEEESNSKVNDIEALVKVVTAETVKAVL